MQGENLNHVTDLTRNVRLHYSGMHVMRIFNGADMSKVVFVQKVKKKLGFVDSLEFVVSWLKNGHKMVVANDDVFIEMWNYCEPDENGYIDVILRRLSEPPKKTPTRSSLRLKHKQFKEEMAKRTLEFGGSSTGMGTSEVIDLDSDTEADNGGRDGSENHS